MVNQQVTELYYRLETTNSWEFNSPPSLDGEVELFHYSLDNDKLIIKLKQDCSDVEEARQLVEYFIHSWEIDDALRNGIKRINFVFEDATIIYPNNQAPSFSLQGALILNGPCQFTSRQPCYPNPPSFFRISPDSLTLWQRYEGYLNKNEPLQSMAYACLTFLVSLAGNKKNAAEKYKIDLKILRKLGELTAENKGDKKTARKFKNGGLPLPLTPMENEWIKVALIAIIRRVGEIDNLASPLMITMDDLSTKL